MIVADKLIKRYGDRTAVHDVSFTVKKGEVLGFLGPNGAGKSTTMRMITGYLAPSEGKVTVGGHDMATDPLAAKALIGYLPEVVPLYPEMSVREYLAFVAALKGIPSDQVPARIERVVEKCWLTQYVDRLISHLSKGYRQRVGLAQALIHDPPILILDEPTSGLDPLQQNETRKLFESLRGEHTIILSTHILPEVQALCDRILIISGGTVVAEDSPGNLEARLKSSQQFILQVKGPEDQVRAALAKVPGVLGVKVMTQDGDIHTFEVEAEQLEAVRAAIASAVVGAGWDLMELKQVTLTLEDIFLKLTTRETTGGGLPNV